MEFLFKSVMVNGYYLDGSFGGWGGVVIYDSIKDFINEVIGKIYGVMVWNYVGYWGGFVG